MITWPYIAGFFDGDGCVYKTEGRYQIQLTQAGDIGYTSLRIMGEFLLNEGVFCTYSSKDRNNPKWQITHYLWISRKADVRWFLKKVQPWVRTKKEKVDAALSTKVEIEPVNWKYISGLFDAEGYWTRIGLDKGEVQYSGWGMGMTGEASKAGLEEIRDFIADQGVVLPKVYTCAPSKKGFKDVHKLQANSRAAAVLIGSQMLPYLVIKKTFVQDAIRYLTMFPKRPTFADKLSHPRLIEEYKSGLTLKQIAKKYGLDYSGVWRTFSRIQSAYL